MRPEQKIIMSCRQTGEKAERLLEWLDQSHLMLKAQSRALRIEVGQSAWQRFWSAFHFTAVITLEDEGEGTKYTALDIHGNEAARKQHEEMGFHNGWGAAFDQLVAMIKKGI